MNRFFKHGVLAALLILNLSVQAASTSVGGVSFSESADLHGIKLALNGAGVRYKAVFKVYSVGLYLGRKVNTAEEVLAQPGPKRIAVTMLRDIDANELGKLFTRAVNDNAPRSEISQLVPGLIRMGEIFAEQKKLLEGDSFTVDWIPELGTVLTVRGAVQGPPFKEPEFFNALLRIWLGAAPADWKLKDALLGKS